MGKYQAGYSCTLASSKKPGSLARPETTSWLNPLFLLFLCPYTGPCKYNFHSSMCINRTLTEKEYGFSYLSSFNWCLYNLEQTSNPVETLLLPSIKCEQKSSYQHLWATILHQEKVIIRELEDIASPMEDICNSLLLHTALCRSHRVAAFGPSNPKGIKKKKWLFPLDKLLELIDRWFISHNRKLRGQSPRAKMDSL